MSLVLSLFHQGDRGDEGDIGEPGPPGHNVNNPLQPPSHHLTSHMSQQYEFAPVNENSIFAFI